MAQLARLVAEQLAVPPSRRHHPHAAAHAAHAAAHHSGTGILAWICVCEAGASADHGDVKRQQLRRRGVQLGLGRRKGHVDAAPIFTRFLFDGREVFKLDRVFFGPRAKPVLRAPGRVGHQVVQSHFPPCSAAVDHDDGVALGAGRARRQLGELAGGEIGGFGVGLDLLLHGDQGGRFLDTGCHHILGERQRRLAVQEPLFRQVLHRHAREVLELREQLKVLLGDLCLVLQTLGIELECTDLGLLGAHLLASIFLDRPRPVAAAQNAKAISALGIKRAVDG